MKKSKKLPLRRVPDSVGSENLKFIRYVSLNLEKSLKTAKDFNFNNVLGL